MAATGRARRTISARLASAALLLIVVGGVLCGGLRSTGSSAAQPPAQALGGAASVPRELLVGFAPDATAGQRQSAHTAAGGTLLSSIPQLAVDRVRLAVGADRDQAIRTYQGRPGVRYAEENALYQASLIPNDPWYPAAWGLSRIGAPEAWTLTRGSGAQTLAILDTGIDANHNDLVGRIVFGINTVDSSGDLTDRHGHGTHVAGVASAAGNDRFGVAGVSWNSLVLTVKVLDDTGTGTAASVAAGITFAVDYSALVINASFGGPPSRTLEAAVEYARVRDVLIVAAAGNDNAATLACPACYPSVLAVGAVTPASSRAAFSNYGAGLDIAAPGEEIISTLPVSNPCALCHLAVAPGFGYLSGTSQASAFVAGAAMLVLARYPAASAVQIAAQLSQTAAPVRGFAPPVGSLFLIRALASPLIVRETPTPLPTPVRTATAAPTATGTATVPLQPMQVQGTARIGGSAAPAGTEIVARIGAVVCGWTRVTAAGAFSLSVASAMQTAGCGTHGATITWTLAGAPATPSTTFLSGGAATIALTAPGSGTSTPTVLPPSATPTPPPTGGTGMTVQGLALQGSGIAPDGSVIEARIGGQGCGTATIQSGRFTLLVQSAAQTPGCGVANAPVTFLVGGVSVRGSVVFVAGALRSVTVYR